VQKRPPHNLNKKKSAVRCPATLKTATFSVKDSAKTLSNMSLRAKAVSTAKIENIFPTNKHSAGYCGQKSALFFVFIRCERSGLCFVSIIRPFGSGEPQPPDAEARTSCLVTAGYGPLLNHSILTLFSYL
jgi:hypothetical protein